MAISWKLIQTQERWLAGEKGTIVKDWGGKFRIALAFPNRYAVGMSNLGFQSVYGALNAREEIVCERVFYPEPEDLEILRRDPGRLLSVETQRPVHEFHLLAFSVPFENDYPNIVEMLALAGIPPHQQDRRADHPLVAAGGVALLLNPEPVAPFLDFVFVGEGESLLPDFLDFWKENLGANLSRNEFLENLAGEVEGIYVPSLYRVSYREDGTLESITPKAGGRIPGRVRYRRAELDKSAPCTSVILTSRTEFSDVLLVEIGRGCGRGCRFCAAGFIYRPVRYHSAENLLQALDRRIEKGRRVGLVSAAVSDHPEVNTICDALINKGVSLSFSSLRADTVTGEVAAALKFSEQQTVAIAPEAGSSRLRRVINKNLSDEEILNAVDKLTQFGVLNLKLYFMIGLPTENLEDLEAIVAMAKKIKHHVLQISKGQKRIGSITLSINSFVPKPFTPFQWEPFAGKEVLKQRAAWLKKALRKVPNVRVHFDLPKWAYVQALLARGDRRTSIFLEKVAMEGLSWTQAMRRVPVNPDFWVMRRRKREEVFPWEIIDLGLKRNYLWDEYTRALEEQTSPPCEVSERCKRCGICSLGIPSELPY